METYIISKIGKSTRNCCLNQQTWNEDKIGCSSIDYMRCVCFLVELWWYKQGSEKHNRKLQKNICQIIGAQPIHNPRTTILTTRFWFRVWSSIVPQCFYLEFKGKRWSVCFLCWLKGHRNQPGIVLTEKNDGSESQSAAFQSLLRLTGSGQSNDCTYWRPDMGGPSEILVPKLSVTSH